MFGRLDFDKFTTGYSSSSPTGCITGTTDILSFTGQNDLTYPSVCGELAGQHSQLQQVINLNLAKS